VRLSREKYGNMANHQHTHAKDRRDKKGLPVPGLSREPGHWWRPYLAVPVRLGTLQQDRAWCPTTPVMAALEVDVAVEEISRLLQEIPLGQLLALEAARSPAPSSVYPRTGAGPINWGGDATASTDPIEASLPG